MPTNPIYPPIPNDWRQSESRFSRYQGDWRRAILVSWCEPEVDGKAEVSPTEVYAGQETSFKVVFTVGKDPILAGGHIVFSCPRWVRRVNSVDLQYCAHKSNSVATFSVSRPEVEAEMYLSFTDFQRVVYDVLIVAGELTKGDTVTISVGDIELGGGVFVQPDAKCAPVHIMLDPDGSNRYRRIKKNPAFTVLGAAPHAARLVLPAQSELGKPMTARLVVMDRFDNPSTKYQGRFKLTSTDKKAKVPDSVELRAENKGILTFEMSFDSPGLHWITALDEENGFVARSNATVARAAPSAGALNLYFGEIHAHSDLSDGRGDTDEYYTWARDAMGLEFSSFGDHCEPWLVYLTPPGTQAEKIARAGDKYYKPHKFVTLLGYEWESGDKFGHKNIYFRHNNPEQKFLGYHSPETNTPAKFFKWGKEQGGIIIPHHVKFNGRTDWSVRDDDAQRLVEIASQWGVGETGGPYSVAGALAMGHRLGFTAGTDNHWGQPGGSGYHQFFTAVYAPELTRETVFDALRDRYCYGCWGARIILEFFVNGHRMGKEFKMSAEPRTIRVRAIGTKDLEKVEIIRNNAVIFTLQGDGPVAELTHEDKDPLQQNLLTGAFAGQEPFAFYYARITQIDGAMAWSSPVWVTMEK